ncbi:MAG: T9SS type A sorting domain-containing protein, partial [Ignavibacteria bacterium]|nr:T9SS type A sorting domain-containing protein [Ignavibacteria bacterium]
SYSQPKFTSADMPNVGDQDTLSYLVYYGITNNLDAETGNGYIWNFSSLPFSMYPNFIQIDSFRIKQHYVSAPFTNATIEEYVFSSGTADVNLFSYSNDTLYIHRLGGASSGWALGPIASIAFPITFNNSSVIRANIYTGAILVGERKTTTLYDGFGTLQMPNGKSYSNVFRIKKIERDTSYVVHTVNTATSYIWYKQGGQVPLLRLTYSGALNLYFVYGSKSKNTTTGINERQNDRTVPAEFSLSQNYPNPFNPSTTINWRMAASSYVTLKVYDVLGKEVTTLVNNELEAGSHSVNFDASNLSSGIYFYELRAGNFIQNKKMILMR